MSLIPPHLRAPHQVSVPPQPPVPPPLPAPVRIEGRGLVVPVKYDFPAVCLLTGKTVDLVRMRRTLSWHHPLIALTFFIGVLIYLVIALIVRKQAKISFCINRAERSRRRKWHLANWGIFLMTFISLIIAGSTGISALFWLSPVCFIGSLVVYYMKVRYLYPTRIDTKVAVIRGILPEVMTGISAGMYPPAA